MRDVPAKIINVFVNIANVSAQVLRAPQLAPVATAKTKKYVAEFQEIKYSIQDKRLYSCYLCAILPDDGVTNCKLVSDLLSC